MLVRLPGGSMRPRVTEDRITSPLGFAWGAAPAFTTYEIRLMRSGMLRRGGVRPADRDSGRPQPARVSDHADVEGRKDPDLLSLRMSGRFGGVPRVLSSDGGPGGVGGGDGPDLSGPGADGGVAAASAG